LWSCSATSSTETHGATQEQNIPLAKRKHKLTVFDTFCLSIPRMEQRWKELTADLCGPEIQEKWWTTIHGSLANSKQRKYYYNLQYLERRFSLFEQHRDQLSQPKAVSLAIFFSQ
jgi:hypothetical protein